MAGDTDDRSPFVDERQEDVKLAGSVDELLGAVDRVGDPAAGVLQPRLVVGPFLGQEGVVRECLPDALPNDPVGRQVGVRDRRLVRFDINRSVGPLVEANDRRRRLADRRPGHLGLGGPQVSVPVAHLFTRPSRPPAAS